MRVQVNLHAGQRRIWSNRKRRNVWSCGRRFGKTQLAWVLAFEIMIKGGTCVYTCPTYTDLKNRYEEARNFFEPIADKSVNRFGEITLPNGGRLLMEGLYRYDGLRGNKFDRIIIDEAAHSRYLEEAWNNVLRATLMDKQGDAYFISTPNGSNYFKVLFDRANDDGENWQSFQMPTNENPFILKEEIEDARKETSSIVFAQEYLAEFVDTQGARIKREWLKYSDIPNECQFYAGVDFAISTKETADYTAIVVIGRDKERWYVADTVRLRGSLQEIVKEITRVAEKWKVNRIFAEEVQAQAWAVQELLRTTTLNVKGIRPNRDKLTRFQVVEARFEQGLINLAHGLPNDFEKELLAFTGTNSDAHDDFIDALVYAVMASANKTTGNLRTWESLTL